MTKRLEGNVALITGGTTGIGAATARLFHAEGARVIVTGRNPATLSAARDRLPGIEVVASDTGDPSSTERLFDHVRGHYGRLDVLMLNAAVVPYAALVDLECDDFDEAMRVNVRGPWLTIKYATPLLSRGASVILTGSASAVQGTHGGDRAPRPGRPRQCARAGPDRQRRDRERP